MEKKYIFAGFGGQGILSLGKFVVYAAMEEGHYVTWLPSYGPEMRGGTANCSVVVSDEEVASPVVSVASCVVVMNRPSLDRFADSVESGGIMLVNSSLIDVKVLRTDVSVYYVKANDIALSHGNGRSANIAMFGAFVKATKSIEKQDAENILKKQFGKSAAIDSIMTIFNEGYDAV